MNKIQKWLIFWTLFIGIGALFGSTMMLIEPSGKFMDMYMMLPYFQVLPFAEYLFQDFFFPGLALLLVNGIPQIMTAILLLKRHRFAAIASLCCGFLLMLWICIQFVIFEFNFMSTIYFIFGLTELLLSLKLLKTRNLSIINLKDINVLKVLNDPKVPNDPNELNNHKNQ
jgi:hypothetical protein